MEREGGREEGGGEKENSSDAMALIEECYCYRVSFSQRRSDIRKEASLIVSDLVWLFACFILMSVNLCLLCSCLILLLGVAKEESC